MHVLTRNPSRRAFIAGGLAGAASFATGHAAEAFAADDGGQPPSGALRFYHIHTAEKLDVTYRASGAVAADALAEINRLLRDFRTGEEMPIDLKLLDTLSLVYDGFGRQGWFEIISGYRSPRTNAALRRITTGVAEHSYHMEGRAIDIRLVGIRTDRLRDAAIALGRGGVGYYPNSNFVHIDSGTLRHW